MGEAARRSGRALVVLLAAGLACSQEMASSPSSPDVLLITVDTLRADRLGVYGFALGASPNIDRLAAGGVVFERAVAAASSTAPSHASIMTSRYTRGHSVGHENGRTQLEGLVTLAELFREAGYHTAAFVGNVVLRRRTGFDRGFEVYDDDLPTPEPGRPEIFERLAEQTTERALAWLASARDAPVLLWVHYQDPHGPYTPPGRFRGSLPLVARTGEEPLPVLEELIGRDGIPSYQALPGLRLPSVYASRYAEEIAYADHFIGKLVEAFEAGSERGAVTLLTADHGESLGEEGRYFLHGTSTTPDQAHVPLILRAPELDPGRHAGIVHHVDLLPTLLELAGLGIPEHLDGVPLGPVLRGSDLLPDRIVFCDDGSRLSAYAGQGFTRVSGVAGAWEGEAASAHPRWAAYRWNADGSWQPADEGELPVDRIRSYYEVAVPMVDAQAPGPGLRRMLRSLGYTDR